MKKWIMLTLSLLALALLVTSCEIEPADENATVRFSIANDRARTISSDTASIAIAKYKFTLVRGTTSGQTEDYKTETKRYTFEFTKNTDGTYQINNILPGPYTIYCEALTSSGAVIGASNTIETSLRRGQSNFSLVISALSGSQKAILTYTWDTATYVQTPSFTLKVTDESGKDVSLTSSNHTINTETTGKAVVTLTLPAGSYLVRASLNDAEATNVSYACLSDVVRFTNSTTDITTEEMSFGVLGTVQSKATITTNVSTPVIATLTITTSKESFDGSLKFTGLPSGVTAENIEVDWLVDGELWGSQKGNQGYNMVGIPAGTYRVTCVMKCSSLAGSMGSVSQVITVPGS